MGTADLAREVLRVLAAQSAWEVVLVVAQPDRAVGRGLEVQPPPVKVEALERGLPVVQPARARDPDFLEHLRRLTPDVAVVAAYGQLLPPALLEIPARGCLNVHASLLPRWRGAAPIQWAIAEGDPETGVTIMHMDAGLDTGGIVAMERTPIAPHETGRTLHDRLARIGGELLVRTLPAWLEGSLPSVPQPAEGVTYARKLTREDGRLDWRRPAAELERRVRAFDPWPGAFTTMPDDRGRPVLLKVHAAAVEEGSGAPGEVIRADHDAVVVAAGEGALRLVTLQREGRRRMAAREFLAGGGLRVGHVLGGGAPAPGENSVGG